MSLVVFTGSSGSSWRPGTCIGASRGSGDVHRGRGRRLRRDQYVVRRDIDAVMRRTALRPLRPGE